MRRPTLERLGDYAWLVRFEPRVDLTVNARVHALAGWIRDQRWPGVVDIVPAIASVAIHHSPDAEDLAELEKRLRDCLDGEDVGVPTEGRLVELPVTYGGDGGPDLDEVARFARVEPDEVVRRHCAVTYHVLMLGFLPGFPYLGIVDPVVQVPRRPSPRVRVPAGSVGLAGPQTGIYPVESPGGWQIIGRTQAALFAPSAQPPALLAPGDRVRFVPVAEGAAPGEPSRP